MVPRPRHLLGLLLVWLPALAAPGAAAPEDDAWALGYASAVLEREHAVPSPRLAVRDGVLFVDVESLGALEREELVRALGAIEGVSEVRLVAADDPGAPAAWRPGAQTGDAAEPAVDLFPDRELFEPLMADPRWPHFAAALQSYRGDRELSGVAAVSFGETIPLVAGPGPLDGRVELALHAAVFSVFDLDSDSFDLLNSDFMAGLAGTWRRGDLAVLGRVFHQSSHLGDELLLRDRIDRVNLSFEAVDLLVSYDVTSALRVYGGGGLLVHTDPSDLEPWSWQAGLELRGPDTWWGEVLRPVAGVDLQAREETDWDLDLSARAGFQLESPRLRSTRLQLLLEYYDGHSPNGQFFEREIRYLGLGTHLYF